MSRKSNPTGQPTQNGFPEVSFGEGGPMSQVVHILGLHVIYIHSVDLLTKRKSHGWHESK